MSQGPWHYSLQSPRQHRRLTKCLLSCTCSSCAWKTSHDQSQRLCSQLGHWTLQLGLQHCLPSPIYWRSLSCRDWTWWQERIQRYSALWPRSSKSCQVLFCRIHHIFWSTNLSCDRGHFWFDLFVWQRADRHQNRTFQWKTSWLHRHRQSQSE